MKKTYQYPEIKIVKVQTAKMIAASTQFGINSSDPALENESTIASRRGDSFWDDEED